MTEDTEVERAISGPVETVHAAVANLIKVGGAREGVGGWGQSGEWWRFACYGSSVFLTDLRLPRQLLTHQKMRW